MSAPSIRRPSNLFATRRHRRRDSNIFQVRVRRQRQQPAHRRPGNDGTQNYHLRSYGGKVTDSQALALTSTTARWTTTGATGTSSDTTQTSLKHGLILSSGDVVESEVSYLRANVQVPGAMDATLFSRFRRSGKQTDTSEAWKIRDATRR
ncbi:MAG: hypothetical protein IPJ52_05740, partial [Rhodocyclaceae bacterium]|nr:hypothetical protein [Rhodocyclaceae bacterium]